MRFDANFSEQEINELIGDVFEGDFPQQLRAEAGVVVPPVILILGREAYLEKERAERADNGVRSAQLLKLDGLITAYTEEEGSLIRKLLLKDEQNPLLENERTLFLQKLHSSGHAVAPIEEADGEASKALFLLLEDQYREGDKVLEALSGLDVGGEMESTNGHNRAARFRNFWLRYKMGLGIYEAHPEILGHVSKASATHYFFRRTQEVFSAYGDRRTGQQILNAMQMMVMAGGDEAVHIIAGTLPSEGILAGAQANMLLQLKHAQFNPVPSARDVAEFKHARHELMTQKIDYPHALRAISQMLQNEFAARQIPLHKPEALARAMGDLLGFQLRLADREINGALMQDLVTMAGLSKPKAREDARNRMPSYGGRHILHHLQLMLTAGFQQGFRALLGADAAQAFLSPASEASADAVLKPKPQRPRRKKPNGRPKNGNGHNGGPQPH